MPSGDAFPVCVGGGVPSVRTEPEPTGCHSLEHARGGGGAQGMELEPTRHPDARTFVLLYLTWVWANTSTGRGGYKSGSSRQPRGIPARNGFVVVEWLLGMGLGLGCLRALSRLSCFSPLVCLSPLSLSPLCVCVVLCCVVSFQLLHGVHERQRVDELLTAR